MASEELSWVGTLGNSINVAEDALKLIIGMILGKFRYNLVSTSNIPFFLPDSTHYYCLLNYTKFLF